MKPVSLVVGLAAASVLGTTMVSAATKHQPRHAHHARMPVNVERAANPRPSMEPARMIEVRPGVFISSYGCITDEGYGRWSYCGQGLGVN
jgi:hypothetical protein